MLALRPYGSNTICLAMCPHSGKNPKEIGSDVSKKNSLKAANFFKEFSKCGDSIATNSGHLLILGDFNIHWNCQKNADTKQLADILRSANLRQHIEERTHRHGHILDLVISRDKGVSVSYMLSDHFLINSNVPLQKQFVSAKVIS